MDQLKNEYHSRIFNEQNEEGLLSLGFILRNNMSEVFSNHADKAYNCTIVLKGKGALTDQEGNVYQLQENILYQRLPNCAYTLRLDTSTPWYVFNIIIGRSVYEALKAFGFLQSERLTFEIKMEAYLLEWMEALVCETKKCRNEDLQELYFNVQKLLVALHKADLRHLEAADERLMITAKQLLTANYREDISFQNVAMSLGVPYDKFRKLFKSKTGISPIQYRIQSKFWLAQRLLSEGFTVTETALEVGYEDPFVFSKQFKKYMAVSPKYYKK